MQEKPFTRKTKMDKNLRGKILARVYSEILSWRPHLEDKKIEPVAGDLDGDATTGSLVESQSVQPLAENKEVNHEGL